MKTEGFRDLSVLAVDDEPAVLELTVEILRQLGVARVCSAKNGHNALAVLQQTDPVDVIVSDINMPGMDGIELMRHLGESKVRSGIILVSGEDSRMLQIIGGLSRSHGLYVLGIIEKPLKIERLAALLSEYDRERGGEVQPALHPITEEELAEGCQGGALFPVFQPKVSIRTGEVYGVEALARWNHSTRGVLGPAAFVPLAEATAHIDALTDAMLRKSLHHCREWKAAGIDLHLSVNLSVNNLNRMDLPEYVERHTRAAGLGLSAVILELTESQVMKNLKTSTEILTRLRLKGVGLSIDDFGTGYSSMEQLKRAPFTELKIDRSFVFGAAQDPSARAILEFSVGLGKKLNMTIVAEGAETREDWNVASEAGCDIVQGYVVAKPMPGEEVEQWVKNFESKG